MFYQTAHASDSRLARDPILAQRLSDRNCYVNLGLACSERTFFGEIE